jgi:hypothetical protein
MPAKAKVKTRHALLGTTFFAGEASALNDFNRFTRRDGGNGLGTVEDESEARQIRHGVVAQMKAEGAEC